MATMCDMPNIARAKMSIGSGHQQNAERQGLKGEISREFRGKLPPLLSTLRCD